ncbi:MULTISPECIES: single-stranded DNA-binding protein [Sphingobacterium]|uniref:Single-stranded DNA-binding protein n=1 Tax=Sphingobacterium tenebrionis TaxID=3111775 RepID=A0ABU8I7B1_9SPHI|nr:single-stranded DNA-binding protein [Sphingobacterium sp. CZ-2]
MSSLKNSVQLLGRLGRDAQVKVSQNGVQYCHISFVTNLTYLDKDKNEVSTVQWHSLSIWGSLTRVLEKKGQKGSLWIVQGKLVNNTYLDRNGMEQRKTEVRVDRLLFLSSPNETNLPITEAMAASAKS